MGYYEGREPRRSRSIFAGLGLIFLLALLLFAALITFLYTQCTSEFWQDDWMLYPNAAIVSDTSLILSTQQRILLTTDSPETIRAWYSQRRAEINRAAVVSGDVSAVHSIPDYNLVPDPNGNGTRIVFTTVCPNPWD